MPLSSRDEIYTKNIDHLHIAYLLGFYDRFMTTIFAVKGIFTKNPQA